MTPHRPLALAGLVLIGVVTVVGWRAWSKYTHRTVCNEALGHVRAIGDSAIAFYWDEPVPGEGARRRLPDSVGLTPDAWPRCSGDEPPPVETWSHPSWQALGFAPIDAPFYRYTFIAHPPGEPPGFTVRAIGDLDCDGVTSTFERTMVLDGEHFSSAAGLKVVRSEE